MKTPELILLQLKALGPHSAKMLAERLDITPMGIRQHLQSWKNVSWFVTKKRAARSAARRATGH